MNDVRINQLLNLLIWK